jgi:hypothetical protein
MMAVGGLRACFLSALVYAGSRLSYIGAPVSLSESFGGRVADVRDVCHAR